MLTLEAINLIGRNENVRGGRPYLVGTTITVADIAIGKIYRGQSAEEIAEWYDIAMPQVYAALAYYYSNKTEIDESIREKQAIAARFKEQRIGSRHPPLFR
jgi:uncharacterized protein (DUF433 family)